MDFLYDSNIVVSITFFLFFGLLAYLGVHKLILKGLDDRAARSERQRWRGHDRVTRGEPVARWRRRRGVLEPVELPPLPVD